VDKPQKMKDLKAYFHTGQFPSDGDGAGGRGAVRGGRGGQAVVDDGADEVEEEEVEGWAASGGSEGGVGPVDRDELKRRYKHVMDTKFRPNFTTVSIMDLLRLIPEWRKTLRQDLQRLVNAHGLQRVGDRPGEANLLFECNEDPALVLHGTAVLGMIVRLGAAQTKARASDLLRQGELGSGKDEKSLVLYAIQILCYPGAPTITIAFNSAGGITIHRDRVKFVMRTVLCLGLEDDEALGGQPRQLPAFKARPMYIPPELSGEPDSFLDFSVEVEEGEGVVGTYAGLRGGHAWGPHWASAVGADGSPLSSTIRVIMDFGVASDGSQSLELETGPYPSHAYRGPQPREDDREFVIPVNWLTDPALETDETVITRQISEWSANYDACVVCAAWLESVSQHHDSPVLRAAAVTRGRMAVFKGRISEHLRRELDRLIEHGTAKELADWFYSHGQRQGGEQNAM
jgi:hypothetical protein